MNKHIRAIVGNPHPECGVKGHRVHTTISATGEGWPEWGKTIYGIGGGFIHFESDKDYRDWVSCQKPKMVEETPVVDELDIGGRCVPECGPIGFKAA